MNKIVVVAALIKYDNKYLIAKRSTGDVDLLGKWEFPGGKVKNGESEEAAIEREIEEEFEMKVKANRFVTSVICEYPTKVVDLRLYECFYVSDNFKLHDHSEYKWVNKEKLLEFDLALADEYLVNFLKENDF